MPLIADQKQLYQHALQNQYIIPAFLVWGIESMKAGLDAAVAENSPVIMQILTPTLENVKPFPRFLECIRQYAKDYPVPVIVIDPEKPKQELRETGRLCDLCPTMLDMMGLEQPKEMTGESLIKH